MIDALDRHSHLVVPTLLALAVVPLALTLLVVGAHSPYTHANLMAGYDPAYGRTDQSLVGPPVAMPGMMGAVPLSDDSVERGHQLFVIKDCAACHGLDGRGGIVGPSIAGVNASLLRQVTQKGMGGMPAFAAGALTDGDLQAIAEYLKGTGGSAAAPAPPTADTETPEPTAVATVSQTITPPTAAVTKNSAKTLPSLGAGAKVYAANCASCHGDKGDGKGPAAEGMNPPATNLADVALARRASPQVWRDAILNGIPKTMMPAWKDALSEGEIWSVLFYIRAFAASPAQLAEGKSLYAQNCFICHGDKGDGSGPFAAGANPPPANFTDASKLMNRSSQQLFDTLTKGKGTMPAFESTMSDDQRWELVAYLWTFIYGP